MVLKPTVGDTIYVDDVRYTTHARDNFSGGLAEIVAIRTQNNHLQVLLKERPNHWYQWHGWFWGLELKQDALRERFGSKKAHLDPDWSPNLNTRSP